MNAQTLRDFGWVERTYEDEGRFLLFKGDILIASLCLSGAVYVSFYVTAPQLRAIADWAEAHPMIRAFNRPAARTLGRIGALPSADDARAANP